MIAVQWSRNRPPVRNWYCKIYDEAFID